MNQDPLTLARGIVKIKIQGYYTKKDGDFELLILNEKLFIGKGCHKATYLHPKDQNKCVKILINHDLGARKQLKRELILNDNLQKKHPNLQNLSRYLGTADTNLGVGYIFELVLDFNQQISESLETYLKNTSFLQMNYQRLLQDLLTLKTHMLEQGIIPMEIMPYNLLYQHVDEGRGEFIIIDEIGTAAFIPLEKYFRTFTKARINRKWHRFADFLANNFDNPQVKELALDLVK